MLYVVEGLCDCHSYTAEGMSPMAIIKVKISEARVEYLEHLEARGVKAR